MANKNSNSKSKSTTSVPVPIQRFDLFGPPLLLEGEDAALYQELLFRICGAIKPVDVIDDLRVMDVVYFEWELMRWRGVKFSRLQARVHNALQDFLNEQLNYEAYAEAFAEALAEILQELQKNLAEVQAKELAHQFARWQPDAVEKVRKLLEAAKRDPDDILDQAKDKRAKEIVEQYVRRQPEAIKLVNELLASSGRTMHDLMLEALSAGLDEIEPIDRLIAIAETRRDASLREIDRRLAALGAALRREIQEIEDGEFEEIETTDVTEPGAIAGSS